MLNFKVLLTVIFIVFYIINYKFLIMQLKSLFFKFKKKNIVLFGKKIKKNKNNYVLFNNFSLISWSVLVLIILLISFPGNFILTGECDYSLINDKENECLSPTTKEITITHSQERILNPNNYLQITVYGMYNDTNTKKVLKDVFLQNKNFPDKIKFSFVSVDQDNLTKNMICLYSFDKSKYWAMFNIYSNYNYITEEIINEAYKRLKINTNSFLECREGPFLEEKLEMNKNLIHNSKIYAIPTVFINEKAYVGYNSFKKHFI